MTMQGASRTRSRAEAHVAVDKGDVDYKRSDVMRWNKAAVFDREVREGGGGGVRFCGRGWAASRPARKATDIPVSGWGCGPEKRSARSVPTPYAMEDSAPYEATEEPPKREEMGGWDTNLGVMGTGARRGAEGQERDQRDEEERDFVDAQDGDEGATAGNQADFAAAFDVDTDMEREIFGSDSYSDESDP
ncbi:hypothetical protein DFH09DRAFT_1083040 [Mycena vulgaris]|nr:hypothetical protein DFH09DRAFT_1083040 [Mycena vulgaris]